jgi:ATP-dependent Lhr-like helicase
VHDLLLWLGELSADEIARRAEEGEDASEWIDDLVRQRRALRVRIASEERFVAVEDAARWRDALGVVLDRGVPEAFLGPTKDALVGLVARFARTHGPFTAQTIASRWGIGEASVVAALERLVANGKVLTGAFLASPKRGSSITEYCDAEVLRALKRKTLARLRKTIEPVDAAAFARFLADWQGVRDPEPRARSAGASMEALLRAVGQLEGCPIPASVLEREVLPARVAGYEPHMLDQLLASGEVVWAGIEPIGQHDGRVALYLADREPLLARTNEERPASALHDSLRALFERRGAVFFAEVTRHAAVFPQDVLSALWDLVWSGEVTNDTFEPLRSLGRKEERRGRAPRPARLGPRGSEGRWSLRRARWDREPTQTERATAIARSLLERYGVVLREAASAEGLVGGFANVYDVYRAMEDQGRVRRGYFVAERGATQFALPGAEERLRARTEDEPITRILAATDPANPYGSLLPWPSREEGRLAQRTPGARVVLHDGRLLAWLARGTTSIVTFLPREEPEATHARDALADALLGLATRRRRPMMLATIDSIPAPEHPFAAALVERGFAVRQGALVRLPEREEQLEAFHA